VGSPAVLGLTSLASDIFAFVCSPDPTPKQRRVVDEGTSAVTTPSDVAESSRRTGGAGSLPSKDIPVGDPIAPPYNGSKVLPVARLLHEDRTAGASPDAEEEEESSDGLLEENTASPPRFECDHGEELEDDPQLTAGNMKKFQANICEFTKFSVVSTIVEYFFPSVDVSRG